jgi:predicted nucleic acid-binding protein
MGPLRCVIDSMVFDSIADEPELLALVDRMTSAGSLELLAAAVSIDQVSATPNLARRKRLRRVRVLVVPPAGERDQVRRALFATPGVDEADALIAAAAAAHDVPLVTEDRDLRLAVANTLPRIPLWTWARDLRPRILELGAEPRRPATPA